MKKKNAEVQSRRDFFKKAAKAALPILGIAALASNPIVAKAAEVTANGCKGPVCMGSCRGECKGCLGSCKGSCSGSCHGTCRDRCIHSMR